MPEKPTPTRSRSRQASRAPVHLADVARLAGVSSGTVSRVINQPELVAPETAAVVRSAIDKLGWVPNGSARALASNRTKTIGLIIPNLANPIFAAMISAVQNRLLESGYILLIGFSEYDPAKALLDARSMISRGIDGLILLGENFEPAMWTLIDVQRVPYIILYSHRPTSDRHFVGFDNAKAARKAAAHMVELGHRDFVVLAQQTRGNDRALARLRGFLDEFAARGMAIPPERIVEVPWSVREGHLAFRRVLSTGLRPSAVICSNDYLATGAMAACHEAGIDVPGQMSVIGFDDLEIVAYLQPPLTTVHVPADDIGRSAADVLVDHLERGEPLRSVEFETSLMLRSSCAPV